MKSLILAALMLSTMAFRAAAIGNVDYCTAGSRILLDTTVAMDEDLTSYRGNSCETDPNVKVIFDASAAPNGYGITATYQDGTIGAGGAIQIIGLSDDKAATTAPILIRIERNIFDTDAILYVKGSFPTTSIISIANNRFDVGVQHDLLMGIQTNFISAITIGDYDNYILMFTNMHFNIYDNQINVEDRSGSGTAYETYGIYGASHLYMSTEAGLLVQRNNITGSARSKCVGAYFPRYAFMMGNNTLAQIMGNNMDLVNGVMFHSPTVVVEGQYNSHADFSQNKGTLTPVHSSTYAIIVGPVNLTLTSSVEVADNEVVNIVTETASTSTRIFLNGPAHLRDDSGLYIWYNTMNTKGGSPQIGFGGMVTVEEQGKVYVVGNQMERQEALTLGLPPVYFYAINLRDEGNIAVSQNTFGSPNVNNKPLLIQTSADGTVTHAGNSTFDVCRNTWYSAELTDAATLSSSVSDNLKPLVTDPAMCPAEITSTTLAPITLPTTTTVVRTTVPEDNAAPSLASTCVAAVAAIGALMALLA
eukprot:GILI01000331.1.p1 GENE.GILI01000331.1~~GILI01000331.1.p1  ORF type:complete len:532 (+),score=214.22 GILI01000331.1:61-1656(+)